MDTKYFILPPAINHLTVVPLNNIDPINMEDGATHCISLAFMKQYLQEWKQTQTYFETF
jgi:hypothetical protein